MKKRELLYDQLDNAYDIFIENQTYYILGIKCYFLQAKMALEDFETSNDDSALPLSIAQEKAMFCLQAFRDANLKDYEKKANGLL